MEQISKLREAFFAAAGSTGPRAVYDATVTAVYVDDYTCDIELDGVELPQVRLRAIVSDNYSLEILPVVGSAVIVAMMGDDDFIVLACDQISSWRATTGTTVIGIDDAGVQISRGNETLEKILTDLVKAVLTVAASKDAASLIALKTRIKTLLK